LHNFSFSHIAQNYGISFWSNLILIVNIVMYWEVLWGRTIFITFYICD